MALTTLLIGFVASLLFVSLIAYSLPVFAQGQDNPGKPEVIAVSGIVPGKNLLVHILLEVPPGSDRNQAAAAALANQGARPFTAEEYSTIDLNWDQFSDGIAGNDFVTQNYNPKSQPNSSSLTALLNTHASWNNVAGSSFMFEYGGTTDRCPSLVDECRGPQSFDGKNDVAWMQLRSANTLGVTWSGTTTDEADMALNTNYPWNIDGSDIDIETVFLHENGHAAGIGHSEISGAIMAPVYAGQNRILQSDDVAAIVSIYPDTSAPTNNYPTVTITGPSDNSSFDSATLISFVGTASDIEDGSLTADISWESNLDGSIGTGGSVSTVLSDGTHSITAQVTDVGGQISSDSITITVGTPPVTGTTVGVDSIIYSGSGGKTNDRHLTVSLHVSDDSGNNVSGATVSITLTNGVSTWTATGTTDTTGGVGFTLKNAPSGTYTTTITNVVASGLTWDNDNTHDLGFTKP